ncbi:MAG: DUF4886 domain-containing protein [Clostridia bacterium]|nr:DUF4886 domain-containing protein [Clostridia bacterium]
MKKIRLYQAIRVLAALLTGAALLCCAAACAHTDAPSSPPDSTGSVPEGPTTPTTAAQERPRALKVLACGHSNTAASVKYLTFIAKDLGTEMLVGLNWRGDSTFKTYLDMYKTPNRFAFGKGTETDFAGVNVVLEATYVDHFQEEDWDVIVLDQGFLSSTNPNSATDLPKLMSIVRQYCPDARLFCDLRAPYMEGCTNAKFQQEYGGDDNAMFNAILKDVQENMATNPDVSAIIPAGTLIKSLETSKYKHALFAGDKVHLGVYGSYAAGVMWYAKLTGASVAELKWMPDGVEEAFRDLVIQAVPQILADPYQVIDFGAGDGDAAGDTLIKFKATKTATYVDGGYFAKYNEFDVAENDRDGLDVRSQTGTTLRCIWAFTNDTIERCPYLNYSLWDDGITKICVTKLWNDGVGDIELPIDVGPHSINIAELVAQQDVQSVGYTYVTVYTASAEPVSITHFCLMNEQIAG